MQTQFTTAPNPSNQQESPNDKLISSVNKIKIHNRLSKNIKHTDNPERFYKELDQELEHNLEKMQHEIEREVKRKKVLKLMEKNSEKYREQWKQKIEIKMKETEEKRNKDLKLKVQKHVQVRKFRQEFVQHNIKEEKKKALRQSIQKIREFYTDDHSPNHIPRALSESRFSRSATGNPYTREKRDLNIERSHSHAVQEAEKKRLFKMPKIQHKPIDLSPVEPRLSKRELDAGIFLQKTVIDMQKIESARSKKQKELRKQLRIKLETDKFMMEQRQDRLRLLKKCQLEKRKTLTEKDRSKSEHVLGMKSMRQFSEKHEVQSHRSASKYYPSQIQSQMQPGTSKRSYRKEIKNVLEGYLQQEKTAIMLKLMNDR